MEKLRGYLCAQRLSGPYDSVCRMLSHKPESLEALAKGVMCEMSIFLENYVKIIYLSTENGDRGKGGCEH